MSMHEAPNPEPHCNHDAPAVRDGVCECGERIFRVGAELVAVDTVGTCGALHAVVVEVSSYYTTVRYLNGDTASYPEGKLDTYWTSSGWRAWDGELRWRLMAPTATREAAS